MSPMRRLRLAAAMWFAHRVCRVPAVPHQSYFLTAEQIAAKRAQEAALSA